MSNNGNNTGYASELHVKGNDKVLRAIDALSKHGLITFSREVVFKSSKYTIHFFKPTAELKNLYNLGNEVLIVCCSDGMRDFKSRTKDYIDYILTTKEEFKNRLDKIACFLVDENSDIVKIVDDDRNKNPDSRLIIPFSLNELQNGISINDFNNRLRSVLYVRDLFGIASPLNNETFFFGKDRAALITDLYGKYKQGEPGGLFGLRRIGKTSALYLLRNRINHNGGAAVYFDCTRYHHKN